MDGLVIAACAKGLFVSMQCYLSTVQCDDGAKAFKGGEWQPREVAMALYFHFSTFPTQYFSTSVDSSRIHIFRPLMNTKLRLGSETRALSEIHRFVLRYVLGVPKYSARAAAWSVGRTCEIL